MVEEVGTMAVHGVVATEATLLECATDTIEVTMDVAREVFPALVIVVDMATILRIKADVSVHSEMAGLTATETVLLTAMETVHLTAMVLLMAMVLTVTIAVVRRAATVALAMAQVLSTVATIVAQIVRAVHAQP